MDLTGMTTQEAMMYVALINAGIGLILGLIPLIFGIVRRNLKLGLIGFVGSIIGGAILGLILAIPISGLCTWLILRSANTTATTTTGGGGSLSN